MIKLLLLPLPFLCAILFRLGGVGKDGRFLPFMEEGCSIAHKLWRSIGIGLVIALFNWNWIYAVTYIVAINAFSYGDNYWIRKKFGAYACWLIYGFMLGLASLSFRNAAWIALCFTVLMHLSNTGIPVDTDTDPSIDNFLVSEHTWKLDHAYVELGIGFLATIIYWIK